MDWPSGKAFGCLPGVKSKKVVRNASDGTEMELEWMNPPSHVAYDTDCSTGDVFTVILAVIVAATAMTTIAPQIIALTKAASSADELFKTIDRKSEIDPLSDDGKIPNACKGVVDIRGLSFSYPARPDITVLKNLTLLAPAGKTTALVGASGSGKSTVIGLIERWYDQASGTIYLDGTDIRELNLTWLRTNIRLVQQEPVLFSGTVYENVAFGLSGTEKANLPESEQRALVEKACKDAYAEEFIERLPKVCYVASHIFTEKSLTLDRVTIHNSASALRTSQVVKSSA